MVLHVLFFEQTSSLRLLKFIYHPEHKAKLTTCTVLLHTAGYIDEDGYVFVMSRTDDVMNVAGHRLSSGAMEEVSTVDKFIFAYFTVLQNLV